MTPQRSFVRDTRGGTGFVELLILIALVAFAAIVGVRAFGESVQVKLTSHGGHVAGIGVAGGGSVSDVVIPSTSARMGPRAPISAETSEMPGSGDIVLAAPAPGEASDLPPGGTLTQGFMPGESAGIPDAVSDRFSPQEVLSAIRRSLKDAARDAVRGAFAGVLDPDPTVAGVVGQVVVGLTPVGIAGDLRDIGVSTKRVADGTGSVFDVVLDGIGFVPGLGDLAKGAIGLGVARRAGATAGGELVGEGAFVSVSRDGNEVVKRVKEVVGTRDERVALDAVGRTRLANLQVEFTKDLREDQRLASVIPETWGSAPGELRQPYVEGRRLSELEFEAADRGAEQVQTLFSRAHQRLGLEPYGSGEVEGGYRILVDDNVENFRFNDQGEVTSWFDPIAVFPPGSNTP